MSGVQSKNTALNNAVNMTFADDVIKGLSLPQKMLPSRYFYDAEGSRLFEDITQLPEYYLTRIETEILRAHSRDITKDVAAESVLVEFGSGSSLKTELLLNTLPMLSAYVSVDVSNAALQEAADRLARHFPDLVVRPVLGDFWQPLSFPPDIAKHPRIGFFPGSTIGNFTHNEAAKLLTKFASHLSLGGRLIIGVDMKKDVQTLLNAYDDSAGVTAEFNLNLLTHINRELGGLFELAKFRHKVVYNADEGRIEMHLLSLVDQNVSVCGHDFSFVKGETIHTENSYKYSIDQFQTLARSAGWHPHAVWTDELHQFSIHELRLNTISHTNQL